MAVHNERKESSWLNLWRSEGDEKTAEAVDQKQNEESQTEKTKLNFFWKFFNFKEKVQDEGSDESYSSGEEVSGPSDSIMLEKPENKEDKRIKSKITPSETLQSFISAIRIEGEKKTRIDGKVISEFLLIREKLDEIESPMCVESRFFTLTPMIGDFFKSFVLNRINDTASKENQLASIVHSTSSLLIDKFGKFFFEEFLKSLQSFFVENESKNFRDEETFRQTFCQFICKISQSITSEKNSKEIERAWLWVFDRLLEVFSQPFFKLSLFIFFVNRYQSSVDIFNSSPSLFEKMKQKFPFPRAEKFASDFVDTFPVKSQKASLKIAIQSLMEKFYWAFVSTLEDEKNLHDLAKKFLNSFEQYSSGYDFSKEEILVNIDRVFDWITKEISKADKKIDKFEIYYFVPQRSKEFFGFPESEK